MWGIGWEECCELERPAAVVAAGCLVPLRRAAGDDDARRVADAVRAPAGCAGDVPARSRRGGAAQPAGVLAVEPRVALSAVGGQPAAVVGGRQGLRPRLPRAALRAGEPGRRA